MKEYRLGLIEYEYLMKDYGDKNMLGERSLIEDNGRKIYDISILDCERFLRKIEEKDSIDYYFVDKNQKER